MSNLREGSRVSYVGDAAGRTLGERGKVLAITGSSGHVKWADNKITLEDLRDLAPLVTARAARQAPAPRPDDLDDSLDVGPIHATGVRAVLDAEGEGGVINMLASSGQLATFPSIAEDTRRFVEGKVREEPGLRSAVADLDPDEADGIYSLAAHVLIRDAFGGGDGHP